MKQRSKLELNDDDLFIYFDNRVAGETKCKNTDCLFYLLMRFPARRLHVTWFGLSVRPNMIRTGSYWSSSDMQTRWLGQALQEGGEKGEQIIIIFHTMEVLSMMLLFSSLFAIIGCARQGCS